MASQRLSKVSPSLRSRARQSALARACSYSVSRRSSGRAVLGFATVFRESHVFGHGGDEVGDGSAEFPLDVFVVGGGVLDEVVHEGGGEDFGIGAVKDLPDRHRDAEGVGDVGRLLILAELVAVFE